MIGEPAASIGLVAAGVAGGFLNTVAGGGSLLLVPALMITGAPADVANASSRLAVLAQAATGTAAYARAGALDRGALPLIVPAAAGAIAGAAVATRLDPAVLEPVLVATMIAIALALVVAPRALAPVAARPPARRPVALAALAAAGFYGGLLQAGAGLVLLAVLAGLLGRDLVRANALKAAIVAAYTVPALAVFVAAGDVAWRPALVLCAGNVVGARLAVRWALAARAGALRALVLLMVVITCVVVLLR